MIRLLKINKKYRMHFNEHPKLYNNINNDFGNWYGKIDYNININSIKKNTINKSLKEITEKNEIKISEEYRKVVKKYCYKGITLGERCFNRYICETGWTNKHKKCYRYDSEEGYTKDYVLNDALFLNYGEIELEKKIGCNNIILWLNNNILNQRIKQ